MPRKQDQSKGSLSVEDFVPGTSLIARVKGYPAWPAVVVDEQDLPERVRKAKPSKKVVIPVLFYSDNSFLWISPQDGELLSKEQAEKTSKAKVKRSLRDAYVIAANPPEYGKLVAQALGLNSTVEGSEEEVSKAKHLEGENGQGSQEPELTPESAPRSRRARSAADRAREELLSRPKSSNRKRLKSDVSEPPLEAPKTKKGRKAEASDPEEDSEYVDFGPEETDGNTTGMETDWGSAEDLANSQQARLDLCSSIRQSIQESLLASPSKLDKKRTTEVEAALRQLEEAPEIEISVVRRSKLARVVHNALSLSSLPQALQARLDGWAQRWNTKAEPVIRGIPEEFAPREETEEPEDYNASVDQSREPTEVPESVEGTQIEAKESSSVLGNETVEDKSESAEPNGELALDGQNQNGKANHHAVKEETRIENQPEEPIASH